MESDHPSLRRNAQYSLWVRALDRETGLGVAHRHLTNRRTMKAAEADSHQVGKLSGNFLDQFYDTHSIQWDIYRGRFPVAGGQVWWFR